MKGQVSAKHEGAALGFGGPSPLMQTVENVTGLRIDHYMGIGFGGLVSVVNEVGGVNICLPAALHDTDSGVNLKAGCHYPTSNAGDTMLWNSTDRPWRCSTR